MLAAVSSVANPGPTVAPVSGGGRFDFDDGGTYCGDWEDGKAHGHGVCTGPKGQGEYAGQWAYGFEVQGVYTWPSGNNYEGQWMGGKRHGLGVEAKGRWIYRGEWTHGFKGRYGVRLSDSSGAKYEGTWANGLQDGYGIEFYADGGTFQGQWLRGVRHGYGVRTSAPYGLASHYRQAKALRQSLTSLEEDAGSVLRADSTRENDTRGGFVLRTCSDEPPLARRGSIFARVAGKSSAGTKKIGGGLFSGLKLRKQQSTGDLPQQRRPGKAGSLNSSSSIQSYVSDGSSIQSMGAMTDVDQYDGDSNLSYVSTEEILEANVTEIYMGEWKNDKRAGFGVCDRSDGLKYEGEWFNNKKSGYGITTFKDGSKEEGKYKNNVLVSSSKQRKLLVRSSKLRERIDSSLQAAIRGSQMALQKADIAISRTGMARGKAESADQTAGTTREDMAKARVQAKLYAPSFYQPGPDVTKKALIQMGNAVPGTSLTASNLLYNPALRNSPSPQPPPRIPTQAKDPPKPAAPAYQPPLPVAVAPSPVPNTSEQEPALRVPTPAGRVPTPVVPQEAPMVAASPAASSRIASPVAPTASPTPRPTSPAVAVTAVESAAALAAPAAVDPASVIIKPFTQLHVSSSTVPSPAGQPPPSPAPASPVPPQHLALPSESVDYPENFSGSRRGSAKPVLQRMEGFDADLSGAKFAKVSLQADRFSQYGAKREDSGIGSEIGAPLSTTPGVSAGDLGGGQLGAAGTEEQLLAQQLEQISLPSLQRRKSLPSLVKRDITGSLRYPEEAAADAAAAAAAVLAQPETIMIEGATRKRLVATDQPGAAPAVNAAPTLPNPRTPVSLPKAVVAETISPKLSKSQMNRSFTDLASANQGTEGISRVEASQLGSQRREEIRRAKEFEAAQTEFDRFRAQMKSASGEATPNVNEEDLDRVSVGSQGSRSSRASRLSAIHGGIQQLQENNRAEEELVNSLQAQIQEQAEIDELMQDYMRERKRQIRIGRRKRDLQEQLAVLKQQDENDIERRMRVEPVEVTPEYLENASTEELQEVYALQQREHRRRQLIRRIGHLDRKMKGSEDRRQRSERRKKNRHERARRISDEEEDAAFPAERSESLMSTNLPPPLQLDAGGGGGGGGEEVPGATNESADQMARIRRGY